MKGRLQAANDLSYRLGQALRHATMLEAYLGHGIETAPTLDMLMEDMRQAALELLEYRKALAELNRQKGKTHGS